MKVDLLSSNWCFGTKGKKNIYVENQMMIHKEVSNLFIQVEMQSQNASMWSRELKEQKRRRDERGNVTEKQFGQKRGDGNE